MRRRVLNQPGAPFSTSAARYRNKYGIERRTTLGPGASRNICSGAITHEGKLPEHVYPVIAPVPVHFRITAPLRRFVVEIGCESCASIYSEYVWNAARIVPDRASSHQDRFAIRCILRVDANDHEVCGNEITKRFCLDILGA